MPISLAQLHANQKRHRVAIYAIVAFCVILSLSLIVFISAQNATNKEVNYLNNAKADGLKAVEGGLNSNSSVASIPITLGAGLTINQILTNQTEACSYLGKYSKFDWQTLSWQRIQPANKNQWVWGQFDAWVDGIRNCGQEVAVHILSDAQWAIKPFPPEIKEAGNHDMPAKNMQDYYNFVYEVAKHYKGKITRYSIENEAHWPGNWGATVEDYITTLKTAYQAIHSADTSAIIEDSAMSHEGFGYLTANWLISQGKDQQALDFANSYASHMYNGPHPPHFDNIDQVKQILSNSAIQRDIDWYNKIFTAHKYYDHIQIHNGTVWQDLQTVYDFVHTNLKAQGDDKPTDIWEGWYGWTGAPGNGFDPQAQAKDLIKQMVVSFANQNTVFNYWVLNDLIINEGHPGLVDNQGNPRPAATAYLVLKQKLGGAIFNNKVDIKSTTGTGSNTNVYVYKFTNTGKPTYIGWSTGGSQTITLPDFNPSQTITITDISGNITPLKTNTITFTDSPVFIE